MGWADEGRNIAASLAGLTEKDEGKIRQLGMSAIALIYEVEKEPQRQKNALTMISRAIRITYPRTKIKCDTYPQFEDPNGKAAEGKWRHLIFKYLQLNPETYDVVGGEQRAEFKAFQKATKTKVKPEIKPELTFKGLAEMSINLSAESQAMAEKAIQQTGLSLSELIQKSLEVYCKSITKKAEKEGAAIEGISTADLLNDRKYRTYPGRAEELTKRAVRGIKIYNSEIATEADQRWAITQSAISELTKCRTEKIREMMKTLNDDIASHHAGYPELLPKEGATKNYSNSGKERRISEEINLTELVPDGIF